MKVNRLFDSVRVILGSNLRSTVKTNEPSSIPEMAAEIKFAVSRRTSPTSMNQFARSSKGAPRRTFIPEDSDVVTRDAKDFSKPFSRIKTVNKTRFANKAQRRAVKQQARVSLAQAIDLPKRFNGWVEEGFMPEPQDQGQCGGCWAFAITQMMACRYRWAFRNDQLDLDKLSVQYLLDCYGRDGAKNDDMVEACDGAVVPIALNIMTTQGSVSEADLPYASSGCATSDGGVVSQTGGGGGGCPAAWSQTQCQSAQSIYRCRNPVLITNTEDKDAEQYGSISKRTIELNVAAMKAQIYRKGVITSVMEVYDDLFDYTGRGVYAHGANAKLSGVHAVNIVGWDETGAKPFWIVQNSWGVGWGDQGFFYALMYENESLLESEAYAADVDLESPATVQFGLKNVDYDKEAVDWLQYESAFKYLRWSFWTSETGIFLLFCILVGGAYLWKKKGSAIVSTVKKLG